MRRKEWGLRIEEEGVRSQEECTHMIIVNNNSTSVKQKEVKQKEETRKPTHHSFAISN